MDAASSSASAASSEQQKQRILQERFPAFSADIIREVLTISRGNLDLAALLLSSQAGEEDDDDEEEDMEDEADDTSPFTASSPSRVQLHGSHGSRCGYCHATTDGRRSFGLTSPLMTCADYQAMVDLGWRRSGDYYYKPDNRSSCCPNYTIRLDTKDFVISKAQRRVIRKFDSFLEGRKGKEEGTGEGKEEEKKEADEDEQQTELRRAILAAVLQLQQTGQLQTTLTEVRPAHHSRQRSLQGGDPLTHASVLICVADDASASAAGVPSNHQVSDTRHPAVDLVIPSYTSPLTRL